MSTSSSKPSADVGKPYGVISIRKAILPVLIGVVAISLLIWHDAKKEDIPAVIASIHFTPKMVGFILLACLFMFGRDFGLSWRFRTLTDRELRWSQAFKVDLLCEFTSCVTPSAVGGSSLGMIFLHSQGIALGRATTLMFTTLFLDELFFVMACPLLILFTPHKEIFESVGMGFSRGIEWTFWIVYTAITVWTAILFIGIIIKPTWIKRTFTAIFSHKWLRKWQPAMISLADNMQLTSIELKEKPFRFWLEVFGGTALSWTSRYLVVNALFMAFLPGTWCDQWIILVKQFIIWVVLMISPTPGGSGISEYLFSEYYGNLVPTAGIALMLAVFWRLISYYVYLAIGCFLVPDWLKRTFTKK